jgi:hypothetical protein
MACYLREAVSVIVAALCGLHALPAHATQSVTAWMINQTNTKGTSTDSAINAVVSVIDADVQQVSYDSTYAYVESTGIPSYNVGPFNDGNPAVPSDREWVIKIPHTPTMQTGTKTVPGLGAIGLWINGVPIYNSLDAMSYENEGVWNQNAVVAEADGFDAALGHPSPVGMGPPPVDGAYHHHQRPISLLAQLGDTPSQHSPIVGFAFDGYPVYGPYGYDGTDGTGGIVRIESSFQLRNITQRTTLPDGTVLSAQFYGPAVSETYPLSTYAEDFEYVQGLGHLDACNGRFAVTPEYPGGTYAYYTTIDGSNNSAYPYAVGDGYYGVLVTENLSGSVTIPGGVTVYSPSSADTIWVDFSATGVELGTSGNPYNTVAEAVTAVNTSGTLKIVAGTTTETITLAKAMTLEASGGAARIGVVTKGLLTFTSGNGTASLVSVEDGVTTSVDEEGNALARFFAHLIDSIRDTRESGAIREGSVFAKALPYTRRADGARKLGPNAPLAIRMRSDHSIDPASVWGAPEGTSLDVRPVADESLRDVWVVVTPNDGRFFDDLIELSLSVTTQTGEVVDSDPQLFRAGSNDDPADAPTLPTIGLDVPHFIEPEEVYATPQRVWLPVPADIHPDDVQLYYYHASDDEDAGWYRAEDVDGWLVHGSYQTVVDEGTLYLGFLVHHAGIVQLGTAEP